MQKEKNLNKIIKESYSTYLKSEKKKKDQKELLRETLFRV